MAVRTDQFPAITTVAAADTLTGISGGIDVNVSLQVIKDFVNVLLDSGNYFPTDTVEAALQFLAARSLTVQDLYQLKDTDLTAIAALSTTAYGRSLLTTTGAAALRTALAAQPEDADLTAIAGLTTTPFGRSLLTLAAASNLSALLTGTWLPLAGGGVVNGSVTLSGAAPLLRTLSGTGQEVNITAGPGGCMIDSVAQDLVVTSDKAVNIQASLRLPIRTVLGSVSVVDGDHTLIVDTAAGSVVVSLPTPLTGRVLHVKKVTADANTVTLSAAALIDGATSSVLTTRYQRVTVQCDGTTWWTI